MEYRHRIVMNSPSSKYECTMDLNNDQFQALPKALSNKHKDKIVTHTVVSKKPGAYAREINYMAGEQVEFEEPSPYTKENFDLHLELFPENKDKYELVDGQYMEVREVAV